MKPIHKTKPQHGQPTIGCCFAPSNLSANPSTTYSNTKRPPLFRATFCISKCRRLNIHRHSTGNHPLKDNPAIYPRCFHKHRLRLLSPANFQALQVAHLNEQHSLSIRLLLQAKVHLPIFKLIQVSNTSSSLFSLFTILRAKIAK